MTLVEIKDAVKANIGNRTDKDDVIATGITLALKSIGQYHDFRSMFQVVETTVSLGEASLSLPTDLKSLHKVVWVDDTQSFAVLIKPKDWVIVRYPDPASMNTAIPVLGYIERDALVLVPRPNADGTMRVFYTKYPTLETDDSETEILGIDYAVIACASEYVFRSMALWSEADRWSSVYWRELERCRLSDLTQPAVQWAFDGHSSSGVRTLVDPAYDPFSSYTEEDF